jgi:hypothetical protein
LNNPSLLIFVVSSRVGPDVGGLVPKEKVEPEVLRGPPGTSFEELNPEQVKPQCI